MLKGCFSVVLAFVLFSSPFAVHAQGANQTVNNNPETKLFAVAGTGKYVGYNELKGYPEETKYKIYFKGDPTSFSTAIEDLRQINLNEVVIWKYQGKTYQTVRKDLYVFFSDTTWFRNNLKGITDYTLTHEWFVNTFGKTYLDWADGIGYSSNAPRLVEKYFIQTGQLKVNNNVTLTPDAKFEPVETQAKPKSIEEIIKEIEQNQKK
ncbi:hypothetical protein HP567_013100 [Brevibacillus sp. M2.1A]|uniref:hypothetical protein n=1 Tax=Brevibacillus sp. M2.1A TaxID=2738980 RepID=UPI00156A76BC|nr:hypothetical protein [Brevibacillus sp. M2.1A]MCC8435483.1 hypothetical protein [Brevibacillus sp. M2.1A]